MRELEEVHTELADFALPKIIKQKNLSKKVPQQSRLVLTFTVTHSLGSKHFEDKEEEEESVTQGPGRSPGGGVFLTLPKGRKIIPNQVLTLRTRA